MNELTKRRLRTLKLKRKVNYPKINKRVIFLPDVIRDAIAACVENPNTVMFVTRDGEEITYRDYVDSYLYR